MCMFRLPSPTRMNRRQYTHMRALASEYRSGFLETEFPSGRAALRVVRSEHVSELVADLADREARPQRIAHRREQVAVALRRAPHLGQRLRRLVGVPLRPHFGRSLELSALRLRVEPVELDRLRLVLLVAVDSDDHPLAGLDRGRVLVRLVLDLALDEALLDCLDRAPDLVHALD